MSAGTGVRHSEFNASDARTACISCRSGSSPARRGIAPGYEEKHFDDASKRGQLRLIASPDGARRLGDASTRTRGSTRRSSTARNR